MTSDISADIVVVGAGHNGLTCAAYLARAGLDTLLVEARESVGGCASTVADLGARFNICNCDHTMIRAMPIIDELDLAAHGLRYVDTTPTTINVFHDHSQPWALLSDTQATLDSLAVTYPDQVERYRRYLDDALPVAELALEMARTVPSFPRLATRATRSGLAAVPRLLDWSRRSFDDVMGEYFDDWHMTMPAVSLGPTVWGVAPDVPGTGLAALGYATRHLIQTGRPIGGSGALPESIAATFAAAGGRLATGDRVERVLLADGRVAGLSMASGVRIAARAVVAACDPAIVYLDWLDEVPPKARRAVDAHRAQPAQHGYESKVDAIVTGVPSYSFADRLGLRLDHDALAGPTTLVSPSPEALVDAHRGRTEGRVSVEPTMLINVPSALDETMRTPTGDHVLSVEVLFTPYELQGGWPTSGEPRRWLDLWAGFAGPDALDSIRDWRAMTPDRYESEFMMRRGHAPSYGGSPLSVLLGRDRELTRYRTPIDGLYLSGAATFPGAGIVGAPGRNTAAIVRADLDGGMLSRAAAAGRAVLGRVRR